MVLIPDDFHSIFPPSPPLLPLSSLASTLVALLRNYTRRRLYHVFTYIYSILIEKDICDRRNISVKLPCVCVCLIPRALHFSARVSAFFSCFCVNLTKYYTVNLNHRGKGSWLAASCVQGLQGILYSNIPIPVPC